MANMKTAKKIDAQNPQEDNSAPLPPGSPVWHHFLGRQPIGHGDAPPLDVRPPLIGRRVGRALLAVGQGERGLQVAQWESPAYGTVDVDAAGLGDRLALANVEAHKLLDRVKTVRLQHVLHLRMRRQQHLHTDRYRPFSWRVGLELC